MVELANGGDDVQTDPHYLRQVLLHQRRGRYKVVKHGMLLVRRPGDPSRYIMFSPRVFPYIAKHVERYFDKEAGSVTG